MPGSREGGAFLPAPTSGSADFSQDAGASQVEGVEALDIGAMERKDLQALARELKAQGLTNKQIAAHIGKSEATVSRWLSEK